MRRYSLAFVLVVGASLAVAGAGCGCEPAAPPAPLVWDLSVDQDIARVGWPAGVTGDEWVIDGPTTVDLVLNARERGHVTFQRGTLTRSGRTLLAARVLLAPTTLEGAYAQARGLCDQWQIRDRDELEKFHATGGHSLDHPNRGFVYCALNSVPEPRGIQIRESFAGPDTPWYVVFSFGFPRNRPPGPIPPELRAGPPLPPVQR